ncbi:hypothetical protein SMSP2_01377 [Limihaloglobus sulfuriphilus]|uniref:PEP-CTERM protein-sorting domain-containing protein n=1 Tax=Limihaloglobus sulfuriphilus TaxID=1851148 RepID=A0A1Q2ME77_9BACT|nr:hypothetical protein [Limihaloglobus sulfuriphilus]AQQ71013.1 hypothetical protein SMSP2_01377 [Limihaloglobus sulfuriphilus]
MFNTKKLSSVYALCALCALTANASVVTLGRDGLMSLDYYHSSQNLTPRVIDARPSGGSVEFDVEFPGNSGSDSQMFYGSSLYGGEGSLIIQDISGYSQFQMNFELLGIQGYTAQESETFELWVSPMVHDGDTYKFFPSALVSTAAGSTQASPAMDVSLLAAGIAKKGDMILEIGFELHMDDPTLWPASGAVATLLVTPAAGADQIVPEPVSILLLSYGAMFIMSRKICPKK